MIPSHVFVRDSQEFSVEIFNRVKTWNGNEEVPPVVADFVFNVAFLMTAIGIAKACLESIMKGKPLKSIRQHSLPVLKYAYYGTGEVVEPDYFRYPVHILENNFQTCKK